MDKQKVINALGELQYRINYTAKSILLIDMEHEAQQKRELKKLTPSVLAEKKRLERRLALYDEKNYSAEDKLDIMMKLEELPTPKEIKLEGFALQSKEALQERLEKLELQKSKLKSLL